VEDYGKVAATFVETKTGRTVRVAPRLDIHERAGAFAYEESRHYFAQMQAYQPMSDTARRNQIHLFSQLIIFWQGW